MGIRRATAVGAALVVFVATVVVSVVLTQGRPGPVVPVQWSGTAAGRPHRVGAAATVGRVVDGRVVPATARGVRWRDSRVRGAVGPAARPGRLRLPVRGRKPAERVRALRHPAPVKKTGYDGRTSHKLPLSGADVVSYANADGTRTAFEYSVPVNYRRPGSGWAPISTTLVPAGTATAPSPSGSAGPPATAEASGSAAPSASAGPSDSAAPSASAGPSDSAAPPAAGTVPEAGWTEQSEADPETFASHANAANLVSVSLGGGRAVAFGVAGAAPVPGAARGNTVAYQGVLPGSALRFTAGTGVVKEQIVLSSPDAAASWVFPLHLAGLRAVMGPGGIVEFVSAAGKVVAYVPHGFMTDSRINPRSGDGATSFGVTYSVVTAGGRQAIRMTLDRGWLEARSRVFPVTVDPSVRAVNADGTTYVQSPDSSDFSGGPEVHVGTWDGGSHKAKSFLAFGSVASSLHNDTVLGVRLGLFNTWSYSCSPRPVYVYPVTSSWTVTGSKAWPGPATGAAVGRASFATGWAPLGSSNSSGSPCPASWQSIGLDQAGTNLVNGWTHGTVADNGLALGASDSDSFAWKKFSSKASGTGDPFLAVTYTPDGASYRLASKRPVVPVEPGQDGKFAVAVTNTGSSTWTPSNGYEMSYRAFNSSGHLVASHPVFTAMPSTVGPGQTVTVNVTVKALPAGSYAIDFDMYSGAGGSSPVSFTSQGIAPFAVGLFVPEPPPTVTGVYPPTGYVAATLRQQLSVAASTVAGTVSYSFKLTCKPLAGQSCVAGTVSSGAIATPYWTPPAASMQWDTPYQWSVTTTVTTNGVSASTTAGPVSFTEQVPQPGITAFLGGSGGRAYDPLSGNHATSATDAAVASAGPPLQIQRAYNSMDPRTSGAFGAGWSSVADTALRPDNDGTGDVVVTLPDGQQMRFGQNGGGKYAAPMGSPDALVHNSSGTWTLSVPGGGQYSFTATGQLSQITDQNGLGQGFTDNAAGEVTAITDTASGRTLTLTWAPAGAGAAYPHVSSVATQAPGPQQPPLTWAYTYSGDKLTSACAPTGECTSYSYKPGSQYLPSVLDSGPRSYWQLGEAGGAAAADEVDANLGSTDGSYSNVTLGVAGPLAGSTGTAAGFNGTSSSVSLPPNLITDSTDVSIELWFKAATSTASGVLFSYDAQPLAKATGNHQPALYVGGNGQLYGEFWNGSVDPIHTSASVDDGKWHYAVLTASSTSQSLYLDGSLVGTVGGQINQMNMTLDAVGAGYWASWPNNYVTQNGSQTHPAIGYFNGDIGQVAVYPHPLGGPAITAHYAAATGVSPELTQVSLPSGKTADQASYDPATGRLTSYTDPNGGQWAIGQPLATGYKPGPDALGQAVDNVTVTDPGGRQETYSYDMLDGGRQVSYDNGIDPPQTYGYDAAGFLASVTDPDGNLACYTNDVHGNRLTRTWYPVEPASLGGGVGTVTGCGGSAASSPACTATGAPCTTFYGYYYNTANPVDPRNDQLTQVRDGRSSSPADNTYLTSYAYNTAGQLTSSTTPPTSDFPAGRTATSTYSTGSEASYGGGTIPAGLLLSHTALGGAVTSYQYYSDGDLAKVTEPSGRSTVYTYDALGRPDSSTVTTTSDPAGLTTSYSYNPMGQPVTVTFPGVANQVTGVTHTEQDGYAYDTDGNLLSQTQSDLTGRDPSRTTSYTYDDHNQVATTTQPAGATSGGTGQDGGAPSPNPQGATIGYQHDAFGNVAQVTDPSGNVYRFAYNEYNKPTQVTLYTPSTSAAAPTASCTAPAVQDPDGGCDLVLASDAYDPAGLLAATTDAMGRITSNIYDHDQQLIAVTATDPSTTPATGRRTTYTHDGAGNQISQTLSAMSGGAVTTSTLTNDIVDAAGRLTSQVQDATPPGSPASGYASRTTAYTYNAAGQITSKTTGTAAQGGTQVTSYGFNPAGDTTSRTVADGATSLTTTWAYNQDGEPVSMTTPAGNAPGANPADHTTSYTYDQAWNLATMTGPPVSTQTYQAQKPTLTRPVTSYGYDTYGDQTQAQDPNGNTTSYAYDGNSLLTSVTQPPYTPPGASHPVTATTSYAYDENGNLAAATDPAGNITRYTYNALGDQTSMTQPQLPGQSAPGTWNYTYDADGEQLSATDPLGNTTRATYDYFGDQATSTDAVQNTTRYAYDYLGDQTKVTTPDGVTATSSYDHLGELTAIADAYGNTVRGTYTDTGQPATVTSPDGSSLHYGYDQAGNVTSLADYGAAPPGQAAPQLRSESLGYDPDGNLTTNTDPNGDITHNAYNASGQLTAATQPTTATASVTTSYGYDPAGNQTATTGGNGNTTWTTYNTWNLPEQVIEPATPAAPNPSDRTWTTAYNTTGQPATITQPGGITQSYSYDPLGDLTSQTGSGATAPTPARTFTYNPGQQLTSASAPGGTDTYTYTPNGQPATATGPSGTSSYTYNPDGLTASETSPAGTTRYTYDSADRLATETDPLTGAVLTTAYNANSQPASTSYSVNGAAGPTRTLAYDPLGRLASDTLTAASGATLAAENYGYDNNNNLLTAATTGLPNPGTTTYAYNKADQLTSAATGAGTTSYTYDSDGNLTRNGATTSTYNAQDQLTTATSPAGATSYTYTPGGDIATVTPPSGTTQNYSSDAFGQQTTTPAGVAYAYDALGRPVTRTANRTTSLSYLGTTTTLASDGTSTYTYTPAGAPTAAQAAGGIATSTFTNIHGDLTATFTPTSTRLTGSAAYTPYGTPATSGTMPALGYQGNYTDPATGQTNMGARWYDPATAAFTTSDTLAGVPATPTLHDNPYAYASSNPLTTTDPTGHWGCYYAGAYCAIGVLDPPRTGGRTGGGNGSLGTALGGALGLGLGWGFGSWLHSVFNTPYTPRAGQGGPSYGPCAGMEGMSAACGGGYHAAPASRQTGTRSIYERGGGIGGGGGWGGSGGFGFATGPALAPPPPPPPPQDCYAVGCTPPPPPTRLTHDPNITTPASDTTNPRNTNTHINEPNPAPDPTPVTGEDPTTGDIASQSAPEQGGGADGACFVALCPPDAAPAAGAPPTGGGGTAPPVAPAPGAEPPAGPPSGGWNNILGRVWQGLKNQGMEFRKTFGRGDPGLADKPNGPGLMRAPRQAWAASWRDFVLTAASSQFYLLCPQIFHNKIANVGCEVVAGFWAGYGFGSGFATAGVVLPRANRAGWALSTGIGVGTGSFLSSTVTHLPSYASRASSWFSGQISNIWLSAIPRM